MKKVLFITHGLSDGGAQRVSSVICNYLSKSDYEITYISAYSNEKIYKLNSNIKNIYLDTTFKNKFLKTLQRTLKIYKIAKQEKPDIIISFIYWETILLLFYKHAKKIYSLRNAPIFYSKLQMMFIKLIFNHADSVVFQTEEAKNFFNKRIQKKGCIISNPITSNLPFWKNYNHKKHVVTAARLEKQKNLKLLIDAFSKVHEKHPDYELYIYGKGSLREELNNYIIDNNMSTYIFIKDFVSNIHEIIATSSIFVLTSDYEGISNSMIESLGIGIPTICTDCPVGGARMFINNEENGILIPVKNESALIMAINKVIEDEKFAQFLSDNAIKIRKTLSENKIVNEWEKIL